MCTTPHHAGGIEALSSTPHTVMVENHSREALERDSDGGRAVDKGVKAEKQQYVCGVFRSIHRLHTAVLIACSYHGTMYSRTLVFHPELWGSRP